jgi:hypothetical protein
MDHPVYNKIYSTGFHIIKEHLLHFDLSEDKITNLKKLEYLLENLSSEAYLKNSFYLIEGASLLSANRKKYDLLHNFTDQ